MKLRFTKMQGAGNDFVVLDATREPIELTPDQVRRLGDPPALDSLLGALPAAPDTWYLHDIALLDSARGTGAATAVLDLLLRSTPAARLVSLSLTAVNRSAPFWRRHGFERADDVVPAQRLRSYGDDACYMVRRL